MLPSREKAEELLQEAEKCNPGPWGNHSRVAAHCAEKIALGCVRRRYGSFPQEKWNSILALKKYFEDKIGKDIYVAVDKENFRL